jgi:DNA mismatch repair protein MutS2
MISYKRMELAIKAELLYPEEYDLDIVFESKENRKVKKNVIKKTCGWINY